MSVHTSVVVACDGAFCHEVSPPFVELRHARTWAKANRWTYDPPHDRCPVHSGDLAHPEPAPEPSPEETWWEQQKALVLTDAQRKEAALRQIDKILRGY